MNREEILNNNILSSLIMTMFIGVFTLYYIKIINRRKMKSLPMVIDRKQNSTKKHH